MSKLVLIEWSPATLIKRAKREVHLKPNVTICPDAGVSASGGLAVFDNHDLIAGANGDTLDRDWLWGEG